VDIMSKLRKERSTHKTWKGLTEPITGDKNIHVVFC
jgi:hypothetical protein